LFRVLGVKKYGWGAFLEVWSLFQISGDCWQNRAGRR